MEALYANSSGKIKSRKKSLAKENEENRPKEERNTIAPLCQGKKQHLAENDKISWFGQTPSAISASEDPERSNILRARCLIIRIFLELS